MGSNFVRKWLPGQDSNTPAGLVASPKSADLQRLLQAAGLGRHPHRTLTEAVERALIAALGLPEVREALTVALRTLIEDEDRRAKQ